MRWFILGVGLAALGACGSDLNTLVRVDSEPDGDNCEGGGAAIKTGLDHDSDGYLDDDEVTSTQYVCNGGTAVQCAGGTVLTGTISIQSDADWAQLHGVNCVDGDLLVAGTTGASLPEMFDLAIVTGDLVIAANPALTSVAGFGNVREVGGTYLVQGNDALVNLDGIGGLERATVLGIVGNNHLRDLHGLESFGDLNMTLTIAGNADLETLSGLDNLTSTIGSLVLRSNPNLTSVAALAKLHAVSFLEVSGNTRLATLGLPALDKIGFRLLVNTNPVLTTVSLPSLTTLGNLAQFNNDGALVSISLPALLTTSALYVENDNSITTVSAPSLLFVTGLVHFTTVPQLRQIDLSSLTSIGEELIVKSAPALTSFAGFEKLHSIGGNFLVQSNGALRDFTGLSALTLVSGDLTITANAQLATFVGLDAFAEVGGNLTIGSNPLLPIGTSNAFAGRVTVHGTKTID